MQISLYYILFFLSGIAGLIYESIWSHYLKLFLGHAAYSQTLVLVIYMGGMAVGAWLGGLIIKKINNLLLYYAGIEIILGFAAMVFHDIFQRYLSLSFDAVIPSLDNPSLILIYKMAYGFHVDSSSNNSSGGDLSLHGSRIYPPLSWYKRV